MNYLIYEKGIAILKVGYAYKLFSYDKSPFSNGKLLFYVKKK